MALLLFGVSFAGAAGKPAPASALTVWNGRTSDPAAGWGAPDGTTMSAAPKKGHAGATAALITSHAVGTWFSAGWRLVPYGSHTGYSIVGYKTLTFWMRETGGNKPDVWVWLRSGPVDGTRVRVAAHQPRAANGQWNKVSVPLSAITFGAKDFNPKTVQEIDFGGGKPTGIAVYVDDIGFAK